MENEKELFFLALIVCFVALIVDFSTSLKECPLGYGNSLHLLLENNFFIPYETWDKGEGLRWLPEKLRWDSYYDEGYER
jgi:hypothetical protein